MLKSDTTSTSLSNKTKTLDQKLLELYLEETEKQEEDSNVYNASHLLGKLVKRDGLRCLVLNLYPGNEGFSFMLRSRSGVETETSKLSYEESEVLEYIDAAQLPPFLLDLLEKAQVSVFYSGCVIVEVRDYRRSAPGSYDSHYVLLRPSAQSLTADVQALAAEFGGGTWTQDDIHQLEAELLLRISEPLCLDPSPAVAVVNTELNREQKRFSEPSLVRAMKKHTQVAVNRKRKLAQGPAPKELQLLDFLQKKRDKSKAPRTIKSVDTWRQRNVSLSVPQDLEIPDNVFKVLDRPVSPHQGSDNLSMVEEHRLERDPNQEQRMLAVITVYRQRLADGFVGRLYLDHDYSGDDSTMQGCACFFPLGVRQNVDRYLDQFRELFTEEGRRLVKMSTKRPGQPEQVTYTPTQQAVPTPTTPDNTPSIPSVLPAPAAMPVVGGAGLGVAPTTTTTSAMTITGAQALLKQATSMAAAIVSQGEGSGMSLAAKRNIPIQLSLSITPVSSTASILTAQGNQQGGVTVAGQGAQSQTSAQRIKQLGIQHKTTPSPLTSPASTPTSTPQQIAAAILGQQTAGVQKAPTPTPTPPPPNSRTPTPTQPMAPSSLPQSSSLSSRRSSLSTTATPLEALSAPASSQPALPQTHNISFVTQEAVGGSGTTGSGGQGTALSNINIANLSSLPPNINLQSLGLSSVNLSNLGLQHMQVSVSMPSIAVPVPITMINTNPSLLHTHPAILTTSSATGSSPAALVTMVTALPASSASTSSSTSTTGTMSSQHLLMSTGSSQAAVLPSNSGMLSLPVGLTQLMPVTTKTQGSVGLRTPANLPVLQLPGGQQSIQLLSLQQQQRGGPLKTGTLTAAITSTPQQGAVSRPGASSSNAVPLSTVLTSDQLSSLTSLTMGKAGGTASIPAGHVIQLTGGTARGAGVGVAGAQGTSQTLHTQLAFQKAGCGGGGGQTLQFHQLQLKQASTPTLNPTAVAMATAAAASSSSSKGKSKKRGGATPPKSL
ncbi:uncharacterized protein LOC143298825 isoform X2 [Babylonia areolata]